MAKTIKVGVVGCGYWGPNLIRNFRSLPDCSMKVMCDVNSDGEVLKEDIATSKDVRGRAMNAGNAGCDVNADGMLDLLDTKLIKNASR